ncbi:MAG: iron-sulfur cluster insertion protein ErpA [Ectothiorhodospiraceae bacterium]|nr:iron-sulfur cluster insertion protein ErpA [Chromatiales bacterium]MCP5153492.1 iron-sulfur cluster insertion protein ErpA [Ectothiorhodospiraceae bacterium]
MNEVSESAFGASAEQALNFTERAARKVGQLVSQRGLTRATLRVYIEGGGCSGFQYGFTFEDGAADDDIVIARDGVELLVDPMSYQYLAGAEVDYKEDLQGARFVINNPNASTTCGCGQSFGI